MTLAWLECGYRNGSDRMVIVRCVGPEQFFLERVVFPFELLSFSCPPKSEVKIWTHGLGGPELLEMIPVAELVISDEAGDPDARANPAADKGPEEVSSAPASLRRAAGEGSATSLHPRQAGLGAGSGDLVEAWVTAV